MLHRHLITSAAALLLSLSIPAHADDNTKKAKKLFFSANKMVDSGEYAQALSLYREAYSLVPRAGLLLNIGTMLEELGEGAEAANSYADYLTSPDANPEKSHQVREALAGLDRKLGRLVVTLDVDQGIIKIDDRVVGQGPLRRTIRIIPGDHVVEVVVAGEKEPVREKVSLSAGHSRRLVIDRDAFSRSEVSGSSARPVAAATAVRASIDSPSVLEKIHATTRADFDPVALGSSFAVGGSYPIGRGFRASAAALLGHNYGFELGARYAYGPWSVRPVVTATMPVFFIDGLNPLARGSAGAEWQATHHIAVAVELGASYAMTSVEDYDRAAFLASVGMSFSL